jgi:protein involved in polysaccharide export with SLBB domain
VEASLSVQRQNRRVVVEGEVARPGEYVLGPSSSLADALQAAGGVTTLAYLYGAQFSRESVRLTQQENYDRALRDLETDLARAASSQRVSNSEESASVTARSNASSRLIERLRALQPSGRVVLQVLPDKPELPALLLEDGDRLLVPPRPTSVGIFGSVFNSGSYLYIPGRTLSDYLHLAGGPTKGADEGSVFVVRANGQVASNRQGGTWFARGNSLGDLKAEPGDTLFVPEEMEKTTFIQAAKDWTLLLYQFGIGAAGIRSAVR